MNNKRRVLAAQMVEAREVAVLAVVLDVVLVVVLVVVPAELVGLSALPAVLAAAVVVGAFGRVRKVRKEIVVVVERPSKSKMKMLKQERSR